jgi:hypothetical protein
MKKTLIWIALSLPWMTGTTLLVFFCVQEYSCGRMFVQGLHVFGWFLNLMIGACIYLPALMIAGITAHFASKRIREHRLLKITFVVSLVSLILPIAAIPSMKRSFFAGRIAAYRSLDYQDIYEAAKELQKRVTDSGENFHYPKIEEKNPVSLPPAIAQLSPLLVKATPNCVSIQMDGGGAMYHEGIGIVFLKKDSYKLPEGVQRLSETLPVYLYRLYDYRILPDAVEDASDED